MFNNIIVYLSENKPLSNVTAIILFFILGLTIYQLGEGIGEFIYYIINK